MSNDLNSFIKKNRKFIKIKDGESYSGIYRGYKIHPSRFDMSKDTVSYMFEDIETGKILPWDSNSGWVAIEMIKYKEGDLLVLTRVGDGTSTKYTVKKNEVPLPTLKTSVDPNTPF